LTIDQPWTVEEENVMVNYLKQGKTIYNIAKKLGRHEDAIIARIDMINMSVTTYDSDSSESINSYYNDYLS
jgi:hypothetical protein